MEMLKEAFKVALARNAQETDRWTKYKEEQQTAISNLKTFRDSLSIDVMVPVGAKAFMPGQLYHTNEILVSHFQGIFSKVSSPQAQKVAMHRMKMAERRLEDLEKERKMYQDKLDKPLMENMLPSGGELEIVEEYDEKKEKQWRIEHKRRLREEKLKASKFESESQRDKSHEDIMSMLDNLEIMEELDDDLDQLQVQDDETLEKLMSGELKMPEDKKRTTHSAGRDIIIGENSSVAKKSSIVDVIEAKIKTFNEANAKKEVDFTNNNTLPNANDFESDDDSASSSTEDIPPRVLEIEEQAKDLPVADKIKFFKKKLKEVEKELHEIKVKSVDDIDEKLKRMEVREFLSDYIELLKDELVDELQSKQDSLKEKEDETKVDTTNKKRISFSNKEEVQFIDKTQAPNMVTRSKIELSSELYSALNLKPPSTNDSVSPDETSNVAPRSPEVEKKQEILEKVHKSIEFVTENQSYQDFNLIDKIIDLNAPKTHTLEIKFEHSDNGFVPPGYDIDESNEDEVIGSPADIYKVFQDYFPMRIREGLMENLPDPVHPKKDKQSIGTEASILENPQNIHATDLHCNEKSEKKFSHKSRVKFLDENDITTNEQPEKLVKSILKNKDKVKLENIYRPPEKSKRAKKKSNKNEEATGFNAIMGDVVERQSSVKSPPVQSKKNRSVHNKNEQPDPLPEEKFVDVCAPKKRISRFKQMRANS